MLVKNWMSKKVVTVGVNDSMITATKKLKGHAIRMLPVLEKGKLVGIVTDRDLKRASASDATTLEIHELIYLLSQIKIKTIMSENPITVPPDFTIEETAEILFKNKISGVPVVDQKGKVVGIITESDLFRVMMSLTGIEYRGILFAFKIEDRPGSIKMLTDIIREYGGRLASILSSYAKVSKGYRNVYIHMYGTDRSKLTILKEELRNAAEMLYMVDYQKNKREIFSPWLEK